MGKPDANACRLMDAEKAELKFVGWRGILAVGGLAFAVAAAVSCVAPFAPHIQDEFSYLLAADTLRQGRLANPSPEPWEPFQSMHVLVEPTYASKYPIGHALIVAVGWSVFGLPIAGCWLAAGLCAAAATWMLGGVTSRRWATVGGVMVACHQGMQLAWSQTLLSGWLAAAGGCLLAGGIFRLRRRVSIVAAAAIGAGIGLLAVTRPYEGLVASSVSAALLGVWWWQRGLLPRPAAMAASAGIATKPISAAVPFAAAVFLAAALPIAGALGLIACHNWAVTGSPWQMVYSLHEQQYGVAPLFVFGEPQLPELHRSGDLPPSVREYHQGWSLASYQQRPGWRGWLWGIPLGAWCMASFWVALAAIPVLTAAHWSRYRLTVGLAVAIAVQLLASAAVCWIFPHYLAPLLPWLVTLSVIGLRRIFRLFVSAGWLRLGGAYRFVTAVAAVQLSLLAIAASRIHADPDRAWAFRRLAVARQLEASPGKHLVLVTYAPGHDVHQEWVYNAADLREAKVLWAHGHRDDWNRELCNLYGPQRSIWRLAADAVEPELQLVSSP